MKQTHKCHILLMNLKDPAYHAGFLTEYLAFGYLASALRASGHKVTWIDEHTDPAVEPKEFDFHYYLPVDIVGMSPSFATYRRALRWLGQWKKIIPTVITVLGGQHVMMVPDDVLHETDIVDYVCLGEGEAAIGELAEKVYAKKRIDAIPGIAYKKNKVVLRGEALNSAPNMDNLVFPARDSLEKWIKQKK